MAAHSGGRGKLRTSAQVTALRADFGPTFPPVIDLNKASASELGAHPLIGKRLAAKVVRLRQSKRFETAADLLHTRVVDEGGLRAVEQFSFGRTSLRPLLRSVSVDGTKALYVDEAFGLKFSWVRGAAAAPEILSLSVRFPSGRRAEMHVRLPRRAIAASSVVIPGFVSRESGEFYVLATLRDSGGRISRQSGLFTIVTRNPVQLFVTPSYNTQSGAAGAPKYNFSNGRWECNADVRWVNGESRSVNLGRRVEVHASDAGVGEIASFSFNLSSDVVVPAHSTVYGSWVTWHGSGPIHDVFSAKGDLTFRYSMSGSGFSPERSMVWRTMRTIGYNLIRVGDFTAAQRDEYARAASEVASDIFRSRDMTVYGTERYRIEGNADMDADKARWRFIDNDAEFDAMAAKYSVANWYIDVFQVESYANGFGASYVNAPSDKNGTHSGIVIGRDSDTVNLGQTYAHEGGHHLGLEHADIDDGCADTDPTSPNISDNFIFSSSRRDSAVITGCQINKMRQHDFVRSMTP
jgi:hypothetical protein